MLNAIGTYNLNIKYHWYYMSQNIYPLIFVSHFMKNKNHAFYAYLSIMQGTKGK